MKGMGGCFLVFLGLFGLFFSIILAFTFYLLPLAFLFFIGSLLLISFALGPVRDEKKKSVREEKTDHQNNTDEEAP
ncbi:hypothetical protein [Candidatus Manganitrophus noduliformans]|uniref:Uncharacterized protein n=1 Tax=Candidatus Manganitrophus noduliformans TaxID=2606439 RepID=A0A7X6ICI4_9BACT|nr:hypothetical protein [Candidatus Manganitrophus noduliformans]NKE72698.1 hypothetical protein [Candidatus Manganitrophus noduliformans]